MTSVLNFLSRAVPYMGQRGSEVKVQTDREVDLRQPARSIEMNLRSNPNGVRDALIQMGDYAKGSRGENTLERALDLLAEQGVAFKGCVIHGSSGPARYAVLPDGSVKFSAVDAPPHKRERARCLGFNLF